MSVNFVFFSVFLSLIHRVSAYVVGQSPSLIAQSVCLDIKLGESDHSNCLRRRVLIFLISKFYFIGATRRNGGSSILQSCMYVELSKLTVVKKVAAKLVVNLCQ